MKNIAQGFNTAAQDLNPGSRSRESEALPLSHCAYSVNSETNKHTHPPDTILGQFISDSSLLLCNVRNQVIKSLIVARYGKPEGATCSQVQPVADYDFTKCIDIDALRNCHHRYKCVISASNFALPVIFTCVH